MTDLPFETVVTVRYADLDTLAHVNNAAYATYLEEARMAYFRETLGRDLTDSSMVVANLTIDFLRAVESGEVTVGMGVVAVGEKSFTLQYAVESKGKTVATARTVQVAIDPETGSSRRVPDDWRASFDVVEAPETGE